METSLPKNAFLNTRLISEYMVHEEGIPPKSLLQGSELIVPHHKRAGTSSTPFLERPPRRPREES